ncbi:hypothetical protein J5681_07580 [bacterium]|nr:hypothetical protein [bacterium]
MKKTDIAAYFFLLFFFVSCNPNHFYSIGVSHRDRDDKEDEEDIIVVVNDDEEPYDDTENEPENDNDNKSEEKEDNTPATEENCVGLSIPLSLFDKEMRTEPDYVEQLTSLGNPYDNDYFEIYFRDENTKIDRTHHLGIGNNEAEETCTACVTLVIDAYLGGFYFAKSGHITVDYLDPVNYGIKGSLSAKLEREYSWDAAGYNITTESCYEIEGAFDITCEPQCNGKVCGDDYCGRTCGECGENEYCSRDRSRCIPYECEELSFDEVELVNWDYITYAEDNAAGDTTLSDIMTMNFDSFYKIPVGTFDLTSSNGYYTSGFNILFCEDLDVGSSQSRENYYYGTDYSCSKYYRPRWGTLTVSESSGRRNTVGNASFTLFEHLSGRAEEYFVDDGKCYNVDLTWDTFCKPDCTGKICGGDGCGGSCGECGGNTMCNAEQTECVQAECTKIDSLTLYSSSFSSNTLYKQYTYLPNTGGDNENFIDRIVLQFYVPNIEYNRDYDLSDSKTPFTLYIEEDFGLRHNDENDYNYYDYDKHYKIERGTITVESIDTKHPPYIMKAIMKDLRFVEAERNIDGDFIRVEGGNCIELSTGKFNDL